MSKTNANQKSNEKQKELYDWGEITTKKKALELSDKADRGIMSTKDGTFEREYYETMEKEANGFFLRRLVKAKDFFMGLSIALATIILLGALKLI